MKKRIRGTNGTKFAQASKQASKQVLPGCRILNSDYLAAMESLADGSIDALITDPPFGITDCPWDVALDLTAFWEIVRRKLKPSGMCAIFACGKFTPLLAMSNRDWFRYDLVWEKTRPVGFLDANHRPLRIHESILIFGPRFRGATYNAQKTQATKRAVRRWTRKKQISRIYGGHQNAHATIDDGSRHPQSVLKFKSVVNGIHPTQKPLELLEWIVKSYSNRGELVVDPFVGSGTTALACVNLGRRFWGSEKSRKFFSVACRRLSKAEKYGERRKSA